MYHDLLDAPPGLVPRVSGAHAPEEGAGGNASTPGTLPPRPLGRGLKSHRGDGAPRWVWRAVGTGARDADALGERARPGVREGLREGIPAAYQAPNPLLSNSFLSARG